jgi:hypothetical protein
LPPFIVQNYIILDKRGWYKAYEAFANACDDFELPYAAAACIFELASRILERIDIDSLNLLYHLSDMWNPLVLAKYDDLNDLAIESILEEVGIPEEIFKSVCEELEGSLKSFDISSMREKHNHVFCTQITLIGYSGDKILMPIVLSPGEDELIQAFTKIFYESIRQQLSKLCGFVCPFAYMEKCCGRKERLQRIYERLPEEDRKHFARPNCELYRQNAVARRSVRY